MKKLLSLLMVVAMIMSLCLTTFAAEENCPSAAYSDLNTAKWYHAATDYVISKGIMGSASSTSLVFEPNAHVTRAMIASVIYHLNGTPSIEGMTCPFNDIADEKEYSDAITWAYNAKIMNGKTETTFGPGDNISRQEIAAIIYGMLDKDGSIAKSQGLTEDLAIIYLVNSESGYSDGAKIANNAAIAVAVLKEAGIMKGDAAGTFRPQDYLSRAELAQIIFNVSNLISIPDLIPTSDDITIYYTNDVHTYIANESGKGLRYSDIASLKKNTENSLLVDAGDHVQGTAYGSMDKGASVVKIMEATGYDLATLGNHEFDYGMERALNIAASSKIPYVSCNFYNIKDGVADSLVLDSYKVFEINGLKIAFIGITTPESFTKSTPKYFQDDKGNYIYNIAGGTYGKELYTAVQTAIDAASREADVIIALGHLGDDPSSDPWNSEDVIANTTGLDAFIDGHSHSTVEMKKVTDKSGNTVILTQTGSYLAAVGKMTIDKDGNIATKLITETTLAPDAKVKALEDAWIASVDEQLNQKIAESKIDFTVNYTGDYSDKRAIRSSETNMGDLNADAYYWYSTEAGLKPDMAIMNGGGIRASIAAGDWTYKSCKTVNTFGNVLCVVEVTGQQILDALEFGARFTQGDPSNIVENGGFLQVAGCTYKVDTNIENTVQVDDKNVWIGGPTGSYRVYDVKIYDRNTGEYVPLDLKKTYRVCGTNYTLYDCGDGFNMFAGGTHVLDGIAEDYLAMASYLKAFADTDKNGYPDIASANSPLASLKGYFLNYEDAAGAGRIEIGKKSADAKDDEISIVSAVLNPLLVLSSKP